MSALHFLPISLLPVQLKFNYWQRKMLRLQFFQTDGDF